MNAAMFPRDLGRRSGLARILGLVLGLLPGTVAAVAIDIPEGYGGTVGDVIDVPVTTEDLTGLGVTSWECTLSWSASRLTLTDVIEAGTISAPWGDATWSVGAGSASLAAAGAAPLAGAGTLVFLRFQVGPSPGGATVSFGSFLFNEGTPAATTSSGYVFGTALPVITVSPNTGELLPGDTLTFGVSGGTAPFLWGTTDAAVATIDAGGVLTAIAPGSVRVWAEDAAAARDTTNGTIDVRAVRISVPTGLTATPGTLFLIPVSITDASPYGMRSYELEMTCSPGVLEFIGASSGGTLTSGWMAPAFTANAGHIRIAAAGIAPLSGAGTLVYLIAVVPAGASGTTTITIGDALLDESWIPLTTNGSFTVDAPGTITVSPNTATVVVGETLGFSVSAGATPPITWGTTDATVGTIDATGLFTPQAGGTCRVFAVDADGARDSTGTISVYDLRVSAETAVVQTTQPTTPITVSVDRDLSSLAVFGYEMTLGFNGNVVQATAVVPSPELTDPWGALTVRFWSDSVKVAHAGGAPLAGGPAPLFRVLFAPAPGAVEGAQTTLDVRDVVLNEGSPRALAVDGTLTVDDTITGVPGVGSSAGLALLPPRPNPFVDATTLLYAVGSPAGGELRLSVHDAAGRVVRTWDLGGEAAGSHALRWDGRDGAGRRVASGVYFVRLAGEGLEESRKLVRLQ